MLPVLFLNFAATRPAFRLHQFKLVTMEQREETGPQLSKLLDSAAVVICAFGPRNARDAPVLLRYKILDVGYHVLNTDWIQGREELRPFAGCCGRPSTDQNTHPT